MSVKIPQGLLDFLDPIFALFWKQFFLQGLSSETIVKGRMAFSQVFQTGAVSAPQKGKFDEEVKSELDAFGLPPIPALHNELHG